MKFNSIILDLDHELRGINDCWKSLKWFPTFSILAMDASYKEYEFALFKSKREFSSHLRISSSSGLTMVVGSSMLFCIKEMYVRKIE